MQKRHRDPNRYFNEQVYTTSHHVLPFIESRMSVSNRMRVLEIGCGEGGNLKPFANLGCECIGVDLSASKISRGKMFFSNMPNVQLITMDIYDATEELGRFDIIMLRDVIEHIHDQNRFMAFLPQFLHAEAVVFFAFPPWQNPFGGHQQICRNKILSVLPYFHLLPVPVYRFVLKLFGESDDTIASLLEIKQTGISLEQFESLCVKHQYATLRKELYLINPNYEIKFGLKPVKTIRPFSSLQHLRNFYISCGYYLIGKT